MYKNIFFLSIGYWGIYFLISNTPEWDKVISGKVFLDALDSPSLILKLGITFIVGLLGYAQSVVTILENFSSMVKSKKSVQFEFFLHFISFCFSYYVLFKQHQYIVSICFLISIIFGIGSFHSSKNDRRKSKA